MRGIIIRMRTPIHIDDAVQRALPVEDGSRQFPRDRIDFFADLDAAGSAPLVRTGMRPAGKLRQSPDRFVVGLGSHSARLGQRDSHVIAEWRTARAFHCIFMPDVCIFSGEIGRLAECRNAIKDRRSKKQSTEKFCPMNQGHTASVDSLQSNTCPGLRQ